MKQKTVFRTQGQAITLRHYDGSLDFPCDWCKSNSYNNFQIVKDERVQFVFCRECLDKLYKPDEVSP